MDENLAHTGAVDVTCFGAKGDDVTDDSAAFQAAVDFLQGKEGRVVFAAEQPEEHPEPQRAGRDFDSRSGQTGRR
jgi:polygalacturonase